MPINPYKPGDMARTSGAVRWRRRFWDAAGSFTDYEDPVLVIEVKDLEVLILSSCGRTGWCNCEQFVLLNREKSEP